MKASVSSNRIVARNVSLLLVVMLVGCGRQAMRDEQRLDSLLGSMPALAAVEFGSFGKTNIQTQRLEDKQAQAVIAALAKTNRLRASDWERRAIVGWIELMDGTNILAVIDMSDEAVFGFGRYSFKLKSPVQIGK